MIESFFVQPAVCAKLRQGSAGPFVEALATRLAEEGYSRTHVRRGFEAPLLSNTVWRSRMRTKRLRPGISTGSTGGRTAVTAGRSGSAAPRAAPSRPSCRSYLPRATERWSGLPFRVRTAPRARGRTGARDPLQLSRRWPAPDRRSPGRGARLDWADATGNRRLPEDRDFAREWPPTQGACNGHAGVPEVPHLQG